MQKNKILISFLIMTFSWLISVNAYAGASQGNPVALLQYIANSMIKELKANKATLKSKPGIVYKLAYRYVVPYADLAEMSKRVLPPDVWNKATPSQRIQFQKEFTTTVIRTYASSLTSYKDQTVQFYPVRGGYQGLSSVEVRSEISSSESPTINVTYRLLRAGSVWRLYDMSVEGVDMLESFRAQFADILAQGDMNLLLQRMSGHNTRKNS